jgi:hypothetical protein
MEFRPIDLPELIGITLGILTLLIPVTGVTLRFALRPLVEALGLGRAHRATAEQIAVLEKRIALIERQMDLRPQLAAGQPEAKGVPVELNGLEGTRRS